MLSAKHAPRCLEAQVIANVQERRRASQESSGFASCLHLVTPHGLEHSGASQGEYLPFALANG